MGETLGRLAYKLHALPKGGPGGADFVSRSRHGAGLSLGGRPDGKQRRRVNGPAGTVKRDASQVVELIQLKMISRRNSQSIWKRLHIGGLHRSSVSL